MQELEDIASDILRNAKANGATAADVVLVESDAEGVHVRCREVEKVSEAREKRLGLRVFVGRSSAVVSTADLSAESLAKLTGDAIACARVTAPDAAAGLPDPEEIVADVPDLDLYDPAAEEISTEAKISAAKEAEAAALDWDPAITNSEGAEFSSASARVCYANSLGFIGAYNTSGFALHVIPVATKNGTMQRDHWYTAGRKRRLLDSPSDVGRTAAQRTVRRLGARKVKTCTVPVVFEPDAAASLIGHLAGAVSGSAIYRGTSFLCNRLGESVAAPAVNVIDDGTLPEALGSKPFDGEGTPTRRNVLVEEGVLRTYLLDAYSARKLGAKSTGNAARSVADGPHVGPTNLFLAAGSHSPEEILASVERGLYVTEFMGYGVNAVTGDYSRGAVGLWIENGEFVHAVEEVTIAGNLIDMFRDIEMIGSDLARRTSISAPTLKIARMTVAGS